MKVVYWCENVRNFTRNGRAKIGDLGMYERISEKEKNENRKNGIYFEK